MKNTLLLLGIILFINCLTQKLTERVPVSPNPSPEAVELLNYIYEISGMHTLSAQHDQPIFGSAYYKLVYENMGEHPAVKGQDFGFSEPKWAILYGSGRLCILKQ